MGQVLKALPPARPPAAGKIMKDVLVYAEQQTFLAMESARKE
jgi:hypothetical protein